jgi:hypothetical protein
VLREAGEPGLDALAARLAATCAAARRIIEAALAG